MKEKTCIPMLVGILANSDLNRFSIDKLLENNVDSNRKHQPLCLKENCALWVDANNNGSMFVEAHCGLID